MFQNNLYIKLFIYLVCLFTQLSVGQINELIKIDYSSLSSDQDKFTFSRKRFSVNYPFKLNDENYLISGINYNRIDANLNITGLSENFTSDMTQFRQYEFNTAFIHKINKYKKLIAQLTPGLSSNFSENKIYKEDIVFTVGLGVIIDKREETIKKPYRLILGATFSGASGIPYPLPFVSYYRRLSKHWEYNLGVPKTNYKYLFRNGNSKIVFLTRLEGFNSSIQNNITYNNKKTNRFRATLVVGGIGYEHFFTKHIVLYSTFNSVLIDRVRLNYNREEIKKIEVNNAYFFKAGIKFQI